MSCFIAEKTLDLRHDLKVSATGTSIFFSVAQYFEVNYQSETTAPM